MDVRRLRDGEQDALLDLVGRWPLPDVGAAWTARDFFARYVTGDPSFRPDDVWVAADPEGPRSCVQIFPRTLRIRGREVPTGGIGTVFTDPEARGRGLASRLVREAMDDMAARGMELALLFAGPVPFYEALGWRSWPVRRPLLRAPADPSGAAGAGEAFDAGRDLRDVAALHAAYGRERDGVCVRNEAGWRRSLAHSGNPHEAFRVVRRDGRVVAYLRAVCLSRFLLFMEWGRAGDDAAAQALADLFAAALRPRDEDPLAPADRPSPEFRSVAAAAPLRDEALEAALRARGVERSHAEDRTGMFWVAAPERLAARFDEPWRAGDDPEALLARVLPPDRFAFWPADRF